ncbi:hypothetical protein, partial [uncultured Brevundimonas sp.]|uniref:hypothetical protein n=1 Tax=uncultured Brevundimonas sp. TaxID=213418 RepID=UPI002606F40D
MEKRNLIDNPERFHAMSTGYLNIVTATILAIKNHPIDRLDSTWIALNNNLALSIESGIKEFYLCQ